MKCSNCRRPLVVAGHRTKEYRDDSGRVYKTRRSATYRKCPCRVAVPAKVAMSTMNRPVHRVPGYNVDAIDVAAGLRELKVCGYHEPKTIMVIEHALMRWARGEEEAARKGAIDRSFHGINLTCWLRVLAAAMASAVSRPSPPAPSPSVSNRRCRR